MKIILSGGGTGGHITPLLAVAHELKKKRPDAELIYLGEKQGKFKHLLDDDSAIDKTYEISAGKLRRYHNEAWFKKILDIKTLGLNARDLLRFLAGIKQSRKLLKKLEPDIIFIKGGYVGAGVGVAAASLKLSYITHDSDTTAGLANRLIARWATTHAVGMPKEFYFYPAHKTHFTGIPLLGSYQLVDKELKNNYRRELDLPLDSKVILVTGGSQGAYRLNLAVKQIAEALLAQHQDLLIVHQTGQGGEGLYNDLPTNLKKRLHLEKFLNNLRLYSGAADLIISRAGATTLAEFAAQGKACIIVPNAELTGGHQISNADWLGKNQAAKIVHESQLEADSQLLLTVVNDLLGNDSLRAELGRNLHKLAKPNSASELADIIINLAETKSAKTRLA